MHREQKMVAEFHRKYGHPAPNLPTLTQLRRQLRVGLVLEEAIELAEAFGLQAEASVSKPDEPLVKLYQFASAPGPFNWAKSVDALGDLSYVTLGSAVEMGVELEPAFHEIHRSNMTKSIEIREDGKTIKGDTYSPARIDVCLERQLEGRQPPPSDEVADLRYTHEKLRHHHGRALAAITVLRSKLNRQQLESADTEIKSTLAAETKE